MIEAVAVVGDLLRPDGKGRPGGVDRPTLWLFNAIKRQLHLATGLPIEPLTTAELPELRGCIETLRPPKPPMRTGHRFIAAFPLPVRSHRW